jgi:glucose-1-phosphate thymidylyltransferase
MRGIILAGGRGSRLYPMTFGTCKQLLPVFDKPMIYYPLAVLMEAGIREILVISSEEEIPRFRRIFQDGKHLGLSISYAVQHEPKGIAEALLIGESFMGASSVALILGDNIFHGQGLSTLLQKHTGLKTGAVIFGYEVRGAERYGVIEFDPSGQICGIVEKPEVAPSNFAVTGLYFYDAEAPQIARSLRPSSRGELEITDLNNLYLRKKRLDVQLLGRGFAWLDTGTPEALHQASVYVHTIQERQGIKIGCVEEIAYRMGYITDEGFGRCIDAFRGTAYGKYLVECVRS